MSSQVQHEYQFGDFQLLPGERQLLRAGEPVPLPPKAFDTLLVLVENAGHLVEKEEFLKKVWPETFVEEVALANAVSQVRKVLQNGGETKFIETIPKRGYRFVAEVRQTDTVDDINKESAATPVPVITNRAPAWWMRPSSILVAVVATVALALLLGTGSMRHPKPFQTGEIHSIAVLPLADLSGQPGQEYLSDGITDELITALAQMKDVRVISRTSTMRYKNTQKSLPQIARELSVDAVLEGSFVRSGDRVRVRAQLIRAATDEHVWAQAYERKMGDVLVLENDLAKDIAWEIRSHLPEKVAATPSVDPEAHELYLKGRYLWNKRDQQSLALAVDYFKQAVAKKSDYAEAYSGIADCYILMGSYGYMPFAEAFSQAKSAAETALRLNEGLAEAHTSLGMIKIYDGWKWEEARRHFERAIELNPNYATAHHWYGDGYLAPMGKLDEALLELRKAHELDPLSQIIATDIGKELYMARRYDEAIAQLRKVLDEDPEFVQAHNWLGNAYMAKQNLEQANEEETRAFAAVNQPFNDCERVLLLAHSGKSQEARRLLRGLRLNLTRNAPDPGCFALAYTALGEKTAAFALLNQAYEKNPSFMTSLKIWPVYDPLRSDPRFEALERRVGLE